MTIKDIEAFYNMINGEFTRIDYFQYIVVPLRKAVKSDINDNEIINSILQKFDPDYVKKENKSIGVTNPSYKLPGFLIPYARELFNRGELKIKYGEHIGKKRGIDAANLIKTELKKFIISGLETNGLSFSPDIKHNGGDSVVRCYFGDEETLRYFREIFLKI